LLLRKRNRPSLLNQLVYDLLNISELRPEAWVAAALYADQMQQPVKSNEYLDRALLLNPDHFWTHCVQGTLSLPVVPESAIKSFRKANSLDKFEMFSYQGIVEACLAADKPKLALDAAKEALQAMKDSPKALVLVGKVLSSDGMGSSERAKALKAFQKALVLDPNCSYAIESLAELHFVMKKPKEAIELLKSHVSQYNSEFLQTRIAKMYQETGNTKDAMKHYQAALTISPHCVAALQGLETLEQQFKNSDEHDDQIT